MNKAIDHIPVTLNLFPEVTWDRWTGDDEYASVYGWVPQDGVARSDYVLIMFAAEGPWLISTSSARYSSEFSARLTFNSHEACKRVEDWFPGVKATHSNKIPP